MSFEEVTIGTCRLIRGDAREFAGTLIADVLLTDPPYGLPGGARHGLYKGASFTWKHAPRHKGSTIFTGNENRAIDPSVLHAYLANVQWGIVWGGHCYPLPLSSAWLVWDKQTNGAMSDCELAWTNLPWDSIRRVTYLWNGYRKQHPEDRWHPTQKPVALGRWCLEQIPGAVRTVLDPFAGSFAFTEACIQRGLACIAIDSDPRWFDLGCRRIEAAYAQLDLTQPHTWRPPTQEVLAL